MSKSEKLAMYQQLQYEIHTQLSFYDIEINPLIANVFLGAAIVTYYDSDPMEIVNVFQDLYDKKLIAYCLEKRSNIFGLTRISILGSTVYIKICIGI